MQEEGDLQTLPLTPLLLIVYALQTKPVHVYRLCTEGTVEERVQRRAEQKLYLDQVGVWRCRGMGGGDVGTLTDGGRGSVLYLSTLCVCV